MSPALSDADVEAIIRLSGEGNAALMRGDIQTYRKLLPWTHDFTLMGPFGGAPMRGSQMTPERWEAMGRFFANGTYQQQVIQTYRSSDLLVLVLIERNQVEIGGLPAQEWALRVTLVYRREGLQWRMAHRHADPLVARITEPHAAAHARGAAE
jgi:ketosteroid isomerase-like protein